MELSAEDFVPIRREGRKEAHAIRGVGMRHDSEADCGHGEANGHPASRGYFLASVTPSATFDVMISSNGPKFASRKPQAFKDHSELRRVVEVRFRSGICLAEVEGCNRSKGTFFERCDD